MLIKEYRICMPITVEEVRSALDSLQLTENISVQNWPALHDSQAQRGAEPEGRGCGGD